MEFVVGEPDGKTVEIVGPFTPGDYYYLAVNGCKIPYIRLFKNKPQNEWEEQFEWYMILDDRFGAFAHEEELERWGMFLANGMAIAAGYTYHGPDSKPMNLFANRLIGLDSAPED